MMNKILVVDYSVLRQQMYRHVLGRYHCGIVNALHGQEALDLLSADKEIDLVLVDINIAMAGMSGLEFLEKVARLERTTPLPVILISAAGKEDEANQGISLGAREFLTRPFRPTLLHEIIEKIFTREDGGDTPKHLSREYEPVQANSNRGVAVERVCWRGILTQAMSLTLGGELLNLLKGCDTLIVNLDAVEVLDYSCLVLLCAVKRQASEKGKEILLEGRENPAVAQLLRRFQVNGNRLCRAYCGNSCLFD